MTRQFFVLSVVLLISVIINVAFIFDKVMGNANGTLPSDSAGSAVVKAERQTVAGQAGSGYESRSDLLGSFIIELIALKNLATEEGAEKTIKAADSFIMMKKSQFEAIEAAESKNPVGRN